MHGETRKTRVLAPSEGEMAQEIGTEHDIGAGLERERGATQGGRAHDCSKSLNTTPLRFETVDGKDGKAGYSTDNRAAPSAAAVAAKRGGPPGP